ncbi:DUF885 domain-containing protein [Enterocloster lavalensis]|uniref:DUF885 domain-containing protein n=1 Tax=Enterocloster lavalensis TaxID=460384 RepID=UPI001D08A01C|nr:DUF885 domain-containing protein [Enterocloster lavalensis]MCB6341453.1 DUF885 domain-containing protein [Enterocloster lavalensis]
MQYLKSLCRYFLLPVSMAAVLLTACAISDRASGGRTSEPANKSAQPDTFEHYDAKTLTAQHDFDQLMHQLFLDEVDGSLISLHYTLADPAAYGITDYPKTFGGISLEQSQEAMSQTAELLVKLENLDSRLLRQDQLLTYRILKSYLTTQLSAKGLELYDQPLSSSLGVQAQLPILLSEYAFYSKQDVEDYLELLSTIDSYYGEIAAFEQQKTEAGLGLCDAVIDRILASCDAYLLDADHSFMAATFAERLEALPDLTDQEKQDYIARNHQMIDEHFVPAYQLLIDKLTALKGTGGNDKGLCYLPEGKRYYEYMVNSSTGTSYPTIEELKSAMGAQMLKDLKAMNALLTKDPSLADQMYSYSFRLTDPNQILEDLKEQCTRDFPPIDDCSYTIKQVPKALEGTLSPAFYLTVPLDRPEDNSIYINGGSTNSQKNLYSTLAHEGYPGHMYQTQYFNKHNTCELRKLLSFTSYSEGWATYVEYNSYSLDNGLSPELGQLLQHNSAFTLALYAMLDINIHYEGWDLNKVQEYLEQYFQINDTSIISTIYYDVAENPANYLEYYVGYLEIANMQEMAKNQLGAGYTDLGFNTFLLDMGPAPFTVIRNYFEAWLAGGGQAPAIAGGLPALFFPSTLHLAA